MQLFINNYSQTKSAQEKSDDIVNNDNTEQDDFATATNDQFSDPNINRVSSLFRDFIKIHTNEIQNVKTHAKSLAEETINLKMIITEKDVILKNLNETIETKNAEIFQYEEEHTKLKATYKEVKTQWEESQGKYCELEILYDKNLSHFESENAQLKETIEMHKTTHIKLMEEFAANRNELQAKLFEKSQECDAINDKFLQMQSNLEDHMEKLENLQNNFDAYKVEQHKTQEENEKQMIEAYELKIASLNDELQHKENFIIDLQKEKSDMEEAKNKIIDEQSFRINRIENAFTQPLLRVKSGHQQNRALTQHAETQHTSIATTTLNPDVGPDNLVTQTQSLQTVIAADISQSRRISRSRENYFSTDDESSVLSNWHPNITTNLTPNRGFIMRKRPFQRENTIPETSESDNVEQIQAKRSKK